MEQAKFACYLLEKPLEKQTKTIEDEGEQKIKPIEYNKKQLDNLDKKKNQEIVSYCFQNKDK